MSKETGELRESNGQKSSQSRVEDGDSSFHVMMSCVSAHKKKPQMDRLTAFLRAQKQGFECEDTEKLDDDDAEYLKAENQKRVEEMLQKAQEELQKRKEKCSEEDRENNKEVKIPDNEDHNANVLEVFHKMVWLQNQDICFEFGRSCRTKNSNKNVEEKKLHSLPLKRQDRTEYFSGTKQMKAKGRQKNRYETVISTEDLQTPVLGTAVKQKYVQSHGKPLHGSRWQEHMYQTTPLPKLTCWQKKAGADLFPDVSTQTPTVQGAKGIEDELLKLAIDESLRTHRLEKLSTDFTKANCPDSPCLYPNNSEETVQFPLQETVEDESWCPPEGIELGEIKPAGYGQMQGILGNRTEYRDREMGGKKPQFSKQSRDVIPSKQKTGVSRKYETKRRNQDVSDGQQSDSSNGESGISSGEVRQPRSEYKVYTEGDNSGGNFNNFVKGKCEVGIWGPCGNEVCNSHQKDNWHGNKKQDQMWKSRIPKPRRNMGENTAESCMSEVSDNRGEVQVEWIHKMHQTENWDGEQDHNLLQPMPDAHRDWREIMSETYLPEASDSRAQAHVDWNMEKSAADIWKVHSDHVPVSLDMGKGIPQEAIRRREDRDSRNGKEYKNDEWNGNKRLEDIWRDSVSQDADIGKTKEASSFVGEERPSKQEKGMTDHFLGKKPEESAMFTEYDSKVQNDLNKCINKIESSTDVNHNSCDLQVPAERFVNCNPVSKQNSPENVRMLSASCIRDALMHQTHNPRVSSPRSTSQVQHAANSLSPPVTSTAGCFHSGDSLPMMMGIHNQPHVQHVPNQALESCSQRLPVPNIQELFEASVQERLRQLMSMNRIVQMAVMNSTGLPNINPACLQNRQSDLELQAQQMNSLSGTAAPINLHGRLPTNYSDLLLQNNNNSLNLFLAALLNPSLLRENQVDAPKNVPVQSDVSSSCNRIGNTVQMPNSDMYCSGAVSTDASVFRINHASHINYPNMYTNNADSMPLETPAFISNRGTQAKHPPWIPALGISPNYMTPQNYQSSQPYQPAVGSMQNMQHVSPDVYNQLPGVRPADQFTSSKMVIGKGRGRLRP